MVKLREKTLELFELIKGEGGRMTTIDIADALGVKQNSVTGRVNSLVKNDLAYRDKVDEGGDKPVTYVILTEEGMAFTQPTEEE